MINLMMMMMMTLITVGAYSSEVVNIKTTNGTYAEVSKKELLQSLKLTFRIDENVSYKVRDFGHDANGILLKGPQVRVSGEWLYLSADYDSNLTASKFCELYGYSESILVKSGIVKVLTSYYRSSTYFGSKAGFQIADSNDRSKTISSISCR